MIEQEDVLRWGVHEPAIVADWLEAPLLRDPTARAAFECLAASATFENALQSADGPVRELLERLAVEEPDAGEEDDRIAIGARVMVNTVAPRADDGLRHARDFGDWPTARDAAREVLGWIRASEGSSSGGLPLGAEHATTGTQGPRVTDRTL